MRPLLFYLSVVTLCWACFGCSKESNQSTTHVHPHEATAPVPKSLGDLCRKIRDRLEKLKRGQTNPELKSELADLIAWAPEFAADTDIEERIWIPIYESSEQVRLSIEQDTYQWDNARIDQISQLCQIAEDAWATLDPDKRIERYQDDSHDHTHHNHDDHDHDDHDHDDHDHDDHDHDDHHREQAH